MHTLIAASMSMPVAVFHFIISNYARWMEDTVQRIATTRLLSRCFQGQKVPLQAQLQVSSGAGGEIVPGGQ